MRPAACNGVDRQARAAPPSARTATSRRRHRRAARRRRRPERGSTVPSAPTVTPSPEAVTPLERDDGRRVDAVAGELERARQVAAALAAHELGGQALRARCARGGGGVARQAHLAVEAAAELDGGGARQLGDRRRVDAVERHQRAPVVGREVDVDVGRSGAARQLAHGRMDRSLPSSKCSLASPSVSLMPSRLASMRVDLGRR